MGNKARILACARDLYLEKGMSGVSMRKVANEVGITATAIYRHYENKEQMLQHVMAEGFKIFERYLKGNHTGVGPLEDFWRAAEAYKRFALNQRSYYRLIFMSENALTFRKAPRELAGQGNATFHFLLERVEACLKAEVIGGGTANELALQFWSLAHGLVSLYLLGRMRVSRKQFDAIYSATIRNFLEGVKNAE